MVHVNPLTMLPTQRDKLTAAFLEFHRDNPHVYRALVEAARQYVKLTGHSKCSMDLLMHHARWVLTVETKVADEGWKLNDNHTAFYARLIMAREEDLAGLFDLRKSVADTDPNWITEAAA